MRPLIATALRVAPGVLLLAGVACTSPTEPTARVLAQLVDLESGIVLSRDSNPDITFDRFGTVTLHAVTDGSCPVEYPDVDVARHESHAIVLLYEVRRTQCREFNTNDRVRRSHTFEHVVRLEPADGVVLTLEVLAREPNGRLHRTEFSMDGTAGGSPGGG